MIENLLPQGREFFSDTTITYLMLVNAAGLILMAWDKIMAKLGKTRIPEKSIILIAVVGGSVGVWLAMQVFRHKTRHAQFVFGIPLIFILQIVVLLMFPLLRKL
ncbi:MAG TPA: DUF1294 domain-containing protein [Clostridia bacterium]|nr:DUF1294 domain-containing protein [Clostridia bacterium]